MRNQQQDQASPWVVNTTDETFLADVVERSKAVPVVVEFWATWCQPCRMLGPILEKLAAEYDGKFELVKADGDHCPVATAQFNVQAYPTVFGLRDGEAVDYFEGVLPEAQLRQWLDRLMPSEVETLIADAWQLRQSDPAAAEAKLRHAVEASPANDLTARLKLAEFLAEVQQLEEAHAIVQKSFDDGYETADVQRLLRTIELKRSGQQSGGVDACREACAAKPDDLGLQLRLAEALAADGQHEEALKIALHTLQTDKPKHGEHAREIMVGIFDLLPDDSELTHEYRRKLSAALY